MEIEIRSDQVRITGYVNAVERDSKVMPPSMSAKAKGRFVERVQAGAFRRSMQRSPDIKLKLNHLRIIGSTTDGTVKLEEDAVGLRAEVVTNDPEIVDNARSGAFKGWSFGFHNLGDDWQPADNGLERRTLEDILLYEVSLVTKNPAYIATTLELRDEDTICIEQRGIPDDPITTQLQPDTVPDLSIFHQQIEIYKLRGERAE